MKKKNPEYELARIPPAELEYDFFREREKYPFRGTSKKFDLCNAWWMAECSFLAYKELPYIQQTLEKAGMESCRCFETGKAFCFAVHAGEHLIVTFRGTRNSNLNVIQDIITNIQHLLVPAEPQGMVHQGFQEAFLDIWGPGGLGEYLEAYSNGHPETRVWFTGHSLGGAMATMASIRTTGNRVLYTFGSPMVGNKDFARLVPKHSYRIVNSNDVVPHLPPPFPPPEKRSQEYTHAGSLRYIDRKGNVQTKISDRNNKVTGLLKKVSRITNTLADSRSSLLYRVYSLTKTKWKEQIPESKLGEELDRLALLLSSYMDSSVPDHAPVLYSKHLKDNFLQG